MNFRAKRPLATLAMALTLMAGCESQETDASLIASARASLRDGDVPAATVKLKNALQLNPGAREARFLMGVVSYRNGDAVAAEVELRKALELKHPELAVKPLLARALLDQGKYKAVVDEFSSVTLDDKAAALDLSLTLATAYGRLGDRANAERVNASILASDPDYLPGKLLQARLIAGKGEFDAALKALDDILVKHPNSADAHHLAGDVLLAGKGDPTSAVARYRKAIELDPKLFAAHAALIQTTIAKGNVADALQQIETLNTVLPAHAALRFYNAERSYLKKDYKAAREAVQQLLQSAPDSLSVLQLGAAIELQTNSLVQAEAFLTKAMRAAPESAQVRVMLARTYLRQAQPAKALTALKPLLERKDVSAEAMRVAGDALLQSGDNDGAEAMFRKAVAIDPADNGIKTALALTAMAKGESEHAFAALQEIARQDTSTMADMAIVSARLQRNELSEALKALDEVDRKQPKSADASNLRGMILLRMQDLTGSRTHLQQALEKDPAFQPAALNLALLDMREDHFDAAQSRYDALLKSNPKSWQAMLGLARLAMQRGAAKDAVIGQLTAAVQAAPGERSPQLALIEYLLSIKDASAALQAAEKAASTFPNQPEVLMLLGRAYLAKVDGNQAANTFGKVTSLRPKSIEGFMGMAQAYLLSDNVQAAEVSLRRALIAVPNSVEVMQELIKLALRNKKWDKALQVARDVRKAQPQSVVGYLLEADIHAEQKRWDDAANVLRQAITLKAPGAAPMRLHFMLAAGKRPSDAERFASDWLKQHPNDETFNFYLGSNALARGALDEAEKYFRACLALNEKNALAHNNLAWLLLAQKKPGALAAAETATRLAPGEAAFLDTLAQAQVEANKLESAIATQLSAVRLAPEAMIYRLSLAKLYIKAGTKDKARVELEALAREGARFSEAKEVTQLISTL